MKIALFNDWRVGVVDGANVFDITPLVAGWCPEWPFSWMLTFINDYPDGRDAILRYLPQAERRPLSDVRLRPPVPSPSKIIAAPVNYRQHQQEMGGAGGVYAGAVIKTVAHYGLFLKPASAIAGHGDRITLPFSGRRTDHEAEIGVVIGKTVRNVVESEAEEAIFGITGLLDLSVRGQEDRPFRKGFDGFCPIGPWILTREEISNWENIAFELRVNGLVRQAGNTRDMIFNIRRLVALASYQTTLRPGDIIASGTPQGVGEIRPGDHLEMQVAGLGTLTLDVAESYAEPPSSMGEWFEPFRVARGVPG